MNFYQDKLAQDDKIIHLISWHNKEHPNAIGHLDLLIMVTGSGPAYNNAYFEAQEVPLPDSLLNTHKKLKQTPESSPNNPLNTLDCPNSSIKHITVI